MRWQIASEGIKCHDYPVDPCMPASRTMGNWQPWAITKHPAKCDEKSQERDQLFFFWSDPPPDDMKRQRYSAKKQ